MHTTPTHTRSLPDALPISVLDTPPATDVGFNVTELSVAAVIVRLAV